MRIGSKARGHQFNHPGHAEFHQNNKKGKKESEDGNGLGGKTNGFFASVGYQFVGQHGDKSGGESAFGKQAAKQIWQFESNEKGVGYGTGTEEIGKNHIPGKSGNAADEREPSESGN